MSYGIECYDENLKLVYKENYLTKQQLTYMTVTVVTTYYAPTNYKIIDVNIIRGFANFTINNNSCQFSTYTVFNGKTWSNELYPPDCHAEIFGILLDTNSGFGLVTRNINNDAQNVIDDVTDDYYLYSTMTIPAAPQKQPNYAYDGYVILDTNISGSASKPYVLYNIPKVNLYTSGYQPARVLADIRVGLNNTWEVCFWQGPGTPSGTALIYTKTVPTPPAYGIAIYNANGNIKRILGAKRVQSSLGVFNNVNNSITAITYGYTYHTYYITVSEITTVSGDIYTDFTLYGKVYIEHLDEAGSKYNTINVFIGLIHTTADKILSVPFMALDEYGNNTYILGASGSSVTHAVANVDFEDSTYINSNVNITLYKSQDLGL